MLYSYYFVLLHTSPPNRHRRRRLVWLSDGFWIWILVFCFFRLRAIGEAFVVARKNDEGLFWHSISIRTEQKYTYYLSYLFASTRDQHRESRESRILSRHLHKKIRTMAAEG